MMVSIRFKDRSLIRRFGAIPVKMSMSTAQKYLEKGQAELVDKDITNPPVDKLVRGPMVAKGVEEESANPTLVEKPKPKKKKRKKTDTQEPNGEQTLNIRIKR